MENKIPFSQTPPKEPGIYAWRRNASCFHSVVEYNGNPFGLGLHGEWSPRLIPETELLSAKKRIEELEKEIDGLNYQLMYQRIGL